ncbi:MAG: NAD(P)/FAD-dependent oxidoreductase [bacterium]|nr:NAD(P)/FAD-dependent oxidoreductase [bacterium]
MRIAVIGGGASGLAAAIAAAESGAKVTVYESGPRCGRKILATGNGRCNMTNINAGLKNYHGRETGFIKGVMKRFWVDETIAFFEELGIVAKVEDKGRVYPNSDQASAVLDVLRIRCGADGVNMVTGFEVSQIRKTKGGFQITSYKGEKAQADKVIIATGGKAAPDLGSKGTGYVLLKEFGHRITELRPSLVQMRTDGDTAGKLKGIKFTGTVRMGKYAEEGEILFTDYGISGPPIFSLSSRYENQKEIELDLMSAYSAEKLLNMMYMRIGRNPDIPLESFFVGMLNKRIGQVLLKELGIAPLSRKACTLSEQEIRTCVNGIKRWKFGITGTQSWNNAQVTKGGALTEDFNPSTMESKLVNGLYAAGEVLDIDGDCGGYNLQWAWSSGIIAGRSAAKG